MDIDSRLPLKYRAPMRGDRWLAIVAGLMGGFWVLVYWVATH